MQASRRGRAAPRAPKAGAALPAVRVFLPDGEVGALLVRRWQSADGNWVYRVALRAWTSRTASTGEDLTKDLVEIDVPADRVRPVKGVTYDGVPVLRRRSLPPAATPALPAPTRVAAREGPEEWVGERVRRPGPPGTGPGLRLHRPDCWAMSGEKGGTLTTAEARQMIAVDPIAEVCDICDARKILAGPGT
jgi:hypothetical protein